MEWEGKGTGKGQSSYDGGNAKGKQGQRCYNCGKTGRDSRDCRLPRAHKVQGISEDDDAHTF